MSCGSQKAYIVIYGNSSWVSIAGSQNPADPEIDVGFISGIKELSTYASTATNSVLFSTHVSIYLRMYTSALNLFGEYTMISSRWSVSNLVQ